MTDIDREIDEELAQDRALEFWRKYSNVIFFAAIVVVAAAGAFRYYDSMRLEKADSSFVRFQSALTLSQNGKSLEAEQVLEGLFKDGSEGYGEIARLRAAYELTARDPAQGVSALDALSANAKLNSFFRDTARLRAAMARSGLADRKEMQERLQPLVGPDKPFRLAAMELLGLTALKADDFEAAGRWFDQIVVDPSASFSERQRAETFLAVVRSGRKG